MRRLYDSVSFVNRMRIPGRHTQRPEAAHRLHRLPLPLTQHEFTNWISIVLLVSFASTARAAKVLSSLASRKWSHQPLLFPHAHLRIVFYTFTTLYHIHMEYVLLPANYPILCLSWWRSERLPISYQRYHQYHCPNTHRRWARKGGNRRNREVCEMFGLLTRRVLEN